jgi:PAS domain S-box-containing protein
MWATILAGRVWHGQLVNRRKGGSLYPEEQTITPVRDAHGEIAHFITIKQDLSERKRAEEAAQRSQKRLRDLIDGLGPSMFVGLMTPQGILIEANRPALAAAGLKLEDVLGKPFEETYWWAYSQEVQQQLREAIARAVRGESSRYDVQLRAAENHLIDVDFSLQPLRDETGEVVFLVPSANVITERKQTENALRASEARLRELSHRLRTVEETERRAISRELHDRIGQELSTLALILGSLGAKLSQESLRAVAKPLQDMRGLLKSMVANVRDVMAELRPPVLDDYGLLAALRQLVTEFAKRTGIAAELSGIELQPRLPSIVETAMFRISQEALNNIAKHAQAKNVEISLFAAPDRVVLDITDDGIGIDANETLPDKQHWGLITMRERAEAVGIAFRLESAPGAGTRIALELERAAI